MRRRELLKWLCRLAAGYVGLNLVSEIPHLVKINTALFQEARAQPCGTEFCPPEICELEFCPAEFCELEFCPAECPVDELCTTDGCGEDSCTICDVDTEGHACAQKDVCDTDASGDCINDWCDADTSGDCHNDVGPSCQVDEDTCPIDETCLDDLGSPDDLCTDDYSDRCRADSSERCSNDSCYSDASGICQTDVCISDKSGGCSADQCSSDKSLACANDQCVSDSSGGCVNDKCTADSSGGCQTDECTADASGACVSDKCGSDSSGGCTISDRCNADASGSCGIDVCVRDVSSDCGSDLCREDRSPDVCDEDVDCAKDTCAFDLTPRLTATGTNFTGEFNFTCFYIPDDVAIVSTGPLTIKASNEVAVFGAMRLNSSAQISTPAKIDLRTSAWLSEDGSPINFTTALSGGVDETQTALDQNETLPHIVYRSICEKVTAAPAMTIWGASIVSLLLIGIAVGTLRRRKGGR